MAHILTNSSNIVITGTNTFNAIQNIGADKIDEGLKILYKHAAPGALHDSGERFDPPNCHPETRIAVRQKIMDWINDPNSDYPVMWMKGPMGGGKSSIAQALAELYYQRGQLSGSFFFARASPARNNEKSLVATLAYQMSKTIPQIRPDISVPILHDPLIFQSSLKSQIELLIIGPHSHLSGTAANMPRLIIIDGLDECINEDAQVHIVKAFVSAIGGYRDKLPISLKVFIVSRPEKNIEAAFCDPKLSHFVQHLLLNEHWLPDNDIRQFLVDSFTKIRQTHPQGTSFSKHWPTVNDIKKLVEKSSGQFIYVSVVVKFLQSIRNDPIHSLEVILGLTTDGKCQPYAELDALYMHVFSKVKDLPLVLCILSLRLAPQLRGIVFYGKQGQFQRNTTIYYSKVMEDIFNLSKMLLSAALTDLVSVLDIDRHCMQYINFHHASLSEFLEDEGRSGDLFVNSGKIHHDLALRCIPIMKNSENSSSHWWCLHTFRQSYTYLNAEARSLFYDALSTLDIMLVLEKTCTFTWSDHYGDTGDPVANYVEWIFAEHANNLTANFPNSPEHAIQNILTYVLQQFQASPFRSLNRTTGLDIWVFSILYDHAGFGFSSIEKILPILMDLDNSEFEKIKLSQSQKLCWRTLQALPANVLSDVNLFGEYSISGGQYESAALHLFKAIPKLDSQETTTLLWVFGNNGWAGVSRLLSRTPPCKDLFNIFKNAMLERSSGDLSGNDFQKLAYEYVVGSFTKGRNRHKKLQLDTLAAIFSNYMEMTCKAIPGLDSITVEESKADNYLHLTGQTHEENLNISSITKEMPIANNQSNLQKRKKGTGLRQPSAGKKKKVTT